MMPITPKGTLRCSMRRPLSSVPPEITRPTGSASSATSRMPWVMPAMRPGFSASRSISGSGVPFARAASMSARLAARMSSWAACTASAMAISARFFSGARSTASLRDARCARCPRMFRSIMSAASSRGEHGSDLLALQQAVQVLRRGAVDDGGGDALARGLTRGNDLGVHAAGAPG